MLRFFRNIRQRLLTENRVTKYLLYAVGEIFLVMVGILLALQVNNWNESRKIERRVERILSEILVELADNIDQTVALARYYEPKASTSRLVLLDKITEEDISNGTVDNLSSLASSYNKAEISNEAYKNLIQITDEIPEKYREAVSDLKELNTKYFDEIIELNQNVKDLALNNYSYIADNFPWFADFDRTNRDEEIIDFYLTNFRYRNSVLFYATVALANHLSSAMEYRREAIKTYKSIASLLREPGSNPVFHFNPELAGKLVGKWVRGNDSDNEYLISNEEGRLYIELTGDSSKTELIALSKTKFISEEFLNGNLFFTSAVEDGQFIFSDYDSEWHKVTD